MTTGPHSVDTNPRGRLRALFDAVLEHPTDQRLDWIAAHVADSGERIALQRLIAAEAPAARGLLDTPAAERAARIGEHAEPHAGGLIGQRIGAFRLLRLLGQGGMATVFLAEREGADFVQQVAIKLLRRGLYSELEQRLFRRERQALAMLSHPNIARLIDGGMTETGIPYLVMDYIDGVPITQYAVERQLDPGSSPAQVLHARLRLFLVVCRAVDAAHRQLIVHRDLKPSNILVSDDGTVTLLDFGIAKLLDEDDGATRTGLAALTPGYAAPEQYSGAPISTATDVYALGVLLHELLLGTRPQSAKTQRPSARAVEAVFDARTLPLPKSALQAALRGDLYNIVQKALANEPHRRYASAGAFAEDIERHLDGRPVAAHPPSQWYRIRRFVRRHSGSVALSAVFTLGLIASFGVTLWQARIAAQQAERAEAMRDFLFEAFAEAEPGSPRAGPPNIVEVVEQAIARLRTDTRMHAGARTELLTELGGVLRGQGRLDLSRKVLSANYEQTGQRFGTDAALTVAAGNALATSQILAGEFTEARHLLDHLLKITTLNDVATRAPLLLSSAKLATLQHELTRARADAGEGLRLSRQLDDDDALAAALDDFGNVQLSTNDLSGAIATYQELLALRVKHLGPEHVHVASEHAALSRAYRRLGELDRAESHARRALEISRSALPKDHWRLASHHNALMMVLLEQRDYRGARVAAKEGLRINRIAHGADHPETANDLNNVGMLSAQLEDYAAAVALLRESLRLTAAKFGAEHYETAVTRANYGVALALSGAVTAGEAALRHAIASLDGETEPDPDEQAATNEKLARLKLDRGDARAALPLLDRIDALLPRIEGPSTYWDGRAQTLRADALLQLGRVRDAAALLQSASSALARSNKPDPVLLVEVPLLQAQAAHALGDKVRAEAFTTQAFTRLAALRHPPSRLMQRAQRLREISGRSDALSAGRSRTARRNG